MIDIKQIDLGNLNKDELDKVKIMLDISKIQQDISESQARSRQADATIEKMRKENSWFPWLQIITTLITSLLTGGVVVYALSKLL